MSTSDNEAGFDADGGDAEDFAGLNEHFTAPRHFGRMTDPDGVGTSSDPAGHDVIEVAIRVREGRLAEVLCDVKGCRCARAAGSALAELATGKRLDEALAIRNADILVELGGTPDPRDPRDDLGADALHRAIHDYLRRVTASSGLTLWAEPVGLVTRVAEVSPDAPPGFPRLAEIALFPRFAPALDGLAAGAPVWVLWWMHELAPAARATLRAHPRGDRTQPERGVFALRSPARPNPIGMALVHLVEIQENRLLVDGLDARPGSPVLDLKPWSEKDRLD